MVMSAIGYNYDDSYFIACGRTIINTSLVANAPWNTSGEMTMSNPDRWYAIPVTAGSTYSVYWDDASQGSGSYGGNIQVSAYRADKLTAYFVNIPNGYDAMDSSFTVASGESVAYLKAQASWTGSLAVGTYAIKYAAGTPALPSALTPNAYAVGTLPAYDSVLWYSFSTTNGQSYTVQWQDSGNQESSVYTGSVEVSAYYADRSAAYFSDAFNGYSNPWPFTAVGTKVLLKVVVFGLATGSFAIRYY